MGQLTGNSRLSILPLFTEQNKFGSDVWLSESVTAKKGG